MEHYTKVRLLPKFQIVKCCVHVNMHLISTCQIRCPWILFFYACQIPVDRGRHLQRYSVIVITLRSDFALLQEACIFSLIVIASHGYRSEHIDPIIASLSYRSDVIEKRYRIYSLSLLGKIAFKCKYNKTLFCYL
jgi:hypothetical protein